MTGLRTTVRYAKMVAIKTAKRQKAPRYFGFAPKPPPKNVTLVVDPNKRR